MKRLFLLLLFVLLAFYVGWPVWSALQLQSAIKAEDAAAVERKIDFPSVRTSMRPAVTQKVDEMFEKIIQQSAPGAALLAKQLKGQVMPTVVDTSLATLVTPQNVIVLVNDAGPIKDRVERIIREHMGKLPAMPGAGPVTTVPNLPNLPNLPIGGLGRAGTPSTDQPATAAPAAGGGKQSYSLANVKRFAVTGPLSFEIGIAKDPAATVPDVTARMGFTGIDWKLTGLEPRL